MTVFFLNSDCVDNDIFFEGEILGIFNNKELMPTTRRSTLELTVAGVISEQFNALQVTGAVEKPLDIKISNIFVSGPGAGFAADDSFGCNKLKSADFCDNDGFISLSNHDQIPSITAIGTLEKAN